ncbi:HLA class II histocompatibility antigen gamma chain isoform X1 [Paramuricea clavata]|nr:HLA class II histocompatibility antigen gamma chain isoform X1 [Paramuricea clavata]
MCDDDVSCPAYPQASCRMNYCGHCSAEFVFPNGTIADCGKQDVTLKQRSVQCEDKNNTMYICSSSLCKGQTCARNPKATCRVPPFSCDCAVEFYDEDGNKVDCLTECQRKRKDLETGPLLVGAYKPSCDEDGTYSPVQCHGSTGYCWCAFSDGTEWPGTRVRGQPDCTENKRPSIRSVHVRLSFDAKFDNIKDSLGDFKTVLVDHLKGRFGIHPKQVKNLKVSSGSIIVEFELFKHEEGRDIRNVSSQLRDMVS